MVLIRAVIDRAMGEVWLRFPYHPATIEILKSIPGNRWNPARKQWRTSVHGLAALRSAGLKIEETIEHEFRCPITEMIGRRLHPYQLQGADFLISNTGALLTMDPRTGKTPTAIAAAASLLQYGIADSIVISYPASVKGEWERQLKDWAFLNLHPLEGHKHLDPVDRAALSTTPYLVLGVHHEIVSQREEDVHRIMGGRRYIYIVDELHNYRNRKAPRTKAMLRIGHANGGTVQIGDDDSGFGVQSGTCVRRYGLTGTPMRNRPRDLYVTFDFVQPESMGGYWPFCKRYADAHLGNYGWVDKGRSNEDELKLRLGAVSYRKTRAEVAPWLPKSDWTIVPCHLSAAEMKKYRKLEAMAATGAAASLDDGFVSADQRSLLDALAASTMSSKVPVAVERAHDHAQRGVKVLCFAYQHASLKALDDAFEKYSQTETRDGFPPPPHFCAGGWMTPDKRRVVIDQWKACPGPAILLVNILASGIGIDLADAEAALLTELCWVPSDLRQAIDRIQDVHLGKRKTPPLYEALLAKGTIDEDMAVAVLEKVRNINDIVGQDDEMGDVANKIREAGIVDSGRIGLMNTDQDTITSVIMSMRDRLMKRGTSDRSDKDNSESLAADAAEAFDEEETDDESED